MVLFLLPCAITWLSLNRWVVRDGCNPSGSAVDAGLDAAARARRAEHAADGGVVYGQQDEVLLRGKERRRWSHGEANPWQCSHGAIVEACGGHGRPLPGVTANAVRPSSRTT